MRKQVEGPEESERTYELSSTGTLAYEIGIAITKSGINERVPPFILFLHVMVETRRGPGDRSSVAPYVACDRDHLVVPQWAQNIRDRVVASPRLSRFRRNGWDTIGGPRGSSR